jgi:tetratricopeptide (TPR) repeat protein
VELEPADKFILDAAGGWLMLGNAAEAKLELEKISAKAARSPEALMLAWDIQAQAHDWQAAVKTGQSLIQQAPESPEGYIKLAYALHELKRTREAWDTLAPVGERFGENWLIPYNLACYACQLGRADEALKLLRRALRHGDREQIQSMALNDGDLQPIRPQIEKLKR